MSTPTSPETGSTVAAPASSSLPIDAEIGALFGDLNGTEYDDESPEQAGADAGAPPADATAAAPDTPTTGTEGTTPDAEHAGAPPAVAADGVPDAASADPLATATPATYTVDGQERTFDGIKILGEHGAMILAPDLPQVLQRLSERDHLYERQQQQYQERQTWERQRAEYDTALAWQTTNAQGQPVTLKGVEAIEAMRVANAQITTAYQHVAKLFDGSPLDLLTQDAQGNVVWNKQLLENVMLRADRDARTHADTIRTQLQQTRAQVAEQAETIPPERFWQDVEAVWIKEHPTLTAQDKAFVQEQLPRYVRAATAEELARGSSRQVVDPSLQKVIAHLAAQRAESVKAAQAATQAAQENAKRLAAAATARPAAPAPPSTPAQPKRADTQRQAWEWMENAAAGRFTGA